MHEVVMKRLSKCIKLALLMHQINFSLYLFHLYQKKVLLKQPQSDLNMSLPVVVYIL